MTRLNTFPPAYAVINNPTSAKRDILRKITEDIMFPLDEETRLVIQHLEAKFDQEENCGGLAAPQIGYSKRVIILSAEEDEEIKKFRPDFSDVLPKSIWINPTFTPLSSHKTIDWEACFSVEGWAGQVPRFTHISYEAWTPEGKKVEGRAAGFLARLIQHEIDHLDGVLFIDLIPEEELVTRETLKKIRQKS
ncbi:MAG: peptide deformylase [Alphaproteobacteria bacterium]|jgi:peptide deformylase|nr:peptide deformylase [Alphaproteobacteria bacterium]MBP9777252.1 peptide deformylase [Alphaproteobacteria bacterium]